MSEIEPISCPVCLATVPPIAHAGAVSVCGACGSSVVIGSNGTPSRMARFLDLDALTDVEMQQLRRGRGAVARPQRRQR